MPALPRGPRQRAVAPGKTGFIRRAISDSGQQAENKGGNGAEDQKRTERRIVDDLPLSGQLGKPMIDADAGALYELHEETDRGPRRRYGAA